MKSYKITGFDKDQSRAFVTAIIEDTDGNDQEHQFHIPVTFSYMQKSYGTNGKEKEELVSATPQQLQQEIESTIKLYEDSWKEQVDPSPISDELNALIKSEG